MDQWVALKPNSLFSRMFERKKNSGWCFGIAHRWDAEASQKPEMKERSKTGLKIGGNQSLFFFNHNQHFDSLESWWGMWLCALYRTAGCLQSGLAEHVISHQRWNEATEADRWSSQQPQGPGRLAHRRREATTPWPQGENRKRKREHVPLLDVRQDENLRHSKPIASICRYTVMKETERGKLPPRGVLGHS